MPADPHLLLRDTVRQAMDARGLSQRSLARLSGLDPTTLSKWLNNRCNLSSHSLAMVMMAVGIVISAPRGGKEP